MSRTLEDYRLWLADCVATELRVRASVPGESLRVCGRVPLPPVDEETGQRDDAVIDQVVALTEEIIDRGVGPEACEVRIEGYDGRKMVEPYRFQLRPESERTGATLSKESQEAQILKHAAQVVATSNAALRVMVSVLEKLGGIVEHQSDKLVEIAVGTAENHLDEARAILEQAAEDGASDLQSRALDVIQQGVEKWAGGVDLRDAFMKMSDADLDRIADDEAVQARIAAAMARRASRPKK